MYRSGSTDGSRSRRIIEDCSVNGISAGNHTLVVPTSETMVGLASRDIPSLPQLDLVSISIDSDLSYRIGEKHIPEGLSN